MHKNITIVIIDCIEPQKAAQVLSYCAAIFPVERSLLLTHQNIAIENKNIEICLIQKLCSVDEYSQFVLRELYKYIETSHCLLIQTDGFICNPQSWTDSFLDYDFIGAPLTDFPVWHSFLPEDYKELLRTSSFNEQRWPMNGGFSLRSKSLLTLSAQCPLHSEGMAEDNYITVYNRQWFEDKAMVFASKSLAFSFSHENPLRGQAFNFDTCFGFHGKISPQHTALAYRPFQPLPNVIKSVLGLQQNIAINHSFRLLCKKVFQIPFTIDDFKAVSKLQNGNTNRINNEALALVIICKDDALLKLQQTITSAVENIQNSIIALTVFSDSAIVSDFCIQQSYSCKKESILPFLQKPMDTNVLIIESGTMILKSLQCNTTSHTIYFTFDKPVALPNEIKTALKIKHELPVSCIPGFYFFDSLHFALFLKKTSDLQFNSLQYLYTCYCYFLLNESSNANTFEFFKMEHRKWLGDGEFWKRLYEPSDYRIIQFED